MIPKITRGDEAGGLMQYLVGPGKANEHELPHLVAGTCPEFDGQVLDRSMAADIGRALDAPQQMWGKTVSEGAIWQCSLSIGAEEGLLTDEKWSAIAEDFMAGMGLTSPDEGPIRWVAVRHGLSTSGNDHVHLAVQLVRENGKVADVWNAWPRSQKLAGQLEAKHGLRVLQSRLAGVGGPSYSMAESRKANEAGLAEPPRVTLERTVRACAAASLDEGEFIRRVRGEGLLVRPRRQDGGGGAVGYSVAMAPAAGESPIWFGGGSLARDLTLPRLRQEWAAAPPSSFEDEWVTASRQGRLRPGREAQEVPDSAARMVETADRLAEVAAQAYAVGAPEEALQLLGVTHDVAGALAAASHRLESTPGEMAALSRELGRFPQTRMYGPRHKLSGGKAAAMLMLQACDPTGPVGQAIMLRQLLATARALLDVHRTTGAAASGERRRWPMSSADADGIDEVSEQIATMAVTGAAMLTQRWAENRANGLDRPPRDREFEETANRLIGPAMTEGRAMTPEENEALVRAAAAARLEHRWAEVTSAPGLTAADLEFLAANRFITSQAALDDPVSLDAAEAALMRLRHSEMPKLPGGEELLREREIALGMIKAASTPTVEQPAVAPEEEVAPQRTVSDEASAFLAKRDGREVPMSDAQATYLHKLIVIKGERAGTEPDLGERPATMAEASKRITALQKELGIEPKRKGAATPSQGQVDAANRILRNPDGRGVSLPGAGAGDVRRTTTELIGGADTTAQRVTPEQQRGKHKGM